MGPHELVGKGQAHGMNARLLFVATTLSVAGAIAAMPGCTINNSDDSPDASRNTSSSSSSGGATDGGTDAQANADGGGDAGDGGECLASKERGPLCEPDTTPEPAAKCAKECDVASTAFTSDIALAISDCIDDAIVDMIGATATPTDLQCEQVAGPCVAAATAASCQNDVEEYCKGVVVKCPDKGTDNKITKDECLQYFRGATTAGKQLLLDCLETEKTDPNVCKICMDAIKTVHNGD